MKKFWVSLGSVFGVLGIVSVAGAYNIIDVSASSVASTTAYITDLFSDISVFIWLAIGVPLSFYVIRKVIGLVKSGGTK